MSRKELRGSMTVEMAFLMPIILLLISSCILTVFYFHDKNIVSGAAYETAVVGSTKMRESGETDSGEMEALYAERVGDKCILFGGSSVAVKVSEEQIEVIATAEKGRFKLSVLKKAAVTEPEDYIRDKRRIKEVIDGTANNN